MNLQDCSLSEFFSVKAGREIAEFESLGGLLVGQLDACDMDTNFVNSTCFHMFAMNSKETKQLGAGTSPKSCFTLGPFCLDGALPLEASSFSPCLVPHCFCQSLALGQARKYDPLCPNPGLFKDHCFFVSFSPSKFIFVMLRFFYGVPIRTKFGFLFKHF